MQIASTLAEFSVEPDGTIKVFVSLAVILVVALAVVITIVVSKSTQSKSSKNDVEPEGDLAAKNIKDALD